MPVLKMFPHFLEILVKGEEFTDENGDFHAGKDTWVVLCKCDCVPAGRADSLTTPDGLVVSYSYTIYLPKGTREFRVGETVRVSFNRGGQLAEKKEFSVKGFHSYQHQCKMWV